MSRARRCRRRVFRLISVGLCLLLLVTCLIVSPPSLVVGQGKSQAKRPPLQRPNNPPNDKARRAQPPAPDKTPGRRDLPGLSELRHAQLPSPVAPSPIPSLMRSRHKPLKSLGGKKFGDPGTGSGAISRVTSGKTNPAVPERSHHGKARAVSATPPPMPDDSYISNFVYYALARGINSSELTYWTDIARAAYAQGPNSVLVAMREFGRTVFESAEYLSRTDRDCSTPTNAHNYVRDLYLAYLMRDAINDQGGWDFWSGQCQANGREQVRAAFDQSGEFYNDVTSMTPDGSISGYVGSISSARVDPFNQSGDQIAARDCEWNLPLLSLPGRAGLDLGLGLSYSSLVWTPSGPYLYFDEDHGSPSPGFRLGFAAVQWLAFDPVSQRNVYEVVLASGRRIALRQVGSSTTYEAADSSYLQLKDFGSYLILYTTDGTQITYSSYANEWNATEVKDRNGNYLTITNDWRGDIQNITDTLGRVVYFFYDGNSNLSSIAQLWNGNWHYWATFGFGSNLSMNISQFGATPVVGTYNGESIPVLRQVGLADGNYYTFDYSPAGQVNLIRHYRSDNYSNNYTAYDYGSDQRSYAGTSYYDCPRISDSRVYAENWTGAEVVTQFTLPGDGSHQMVTPEGTAVREYYGSGWQNGLVTLTQIYSGGLQKWTTTNYTQDNTGVNYQTNPRVTETNVYDISGNRRRTTIDYQGSFGLPSIVTEYAADASNVIRRTYFDYVNDSPYTDRRIIGLPFRHTVYDGNWAMLSKTEYYYDWGSEHMQNTPAPPTQHYSNYDTNFLVRGNLADVAQFDATDPNNSSKLHEMKAGYDIAGNVTFTRDPVWHQNFISYSDSFSDGGNRNSFAYPTTATDPDGYSSYVQYNYDFGAKTQIQTPQPNTISNTPGPSQTFTYDGAGRISQVTIQTTGAYVHYFYGTYYSYTLSTTNYVGDEAYAVQIFDGLGRVMQAATNNPGSGGGYKATWTQFDSMGRVSRQYNPTEIDGYWNPYGDDAGGAQYTQQTYDWKGRPLVTTHQDSTQKYATYSGCGCAGGEVVTLTDEVGRQQKSYSDVMGRQSRTEVLNSNGTVYSATLNTFDGLDHITNVRQWSGPENGGGAYQDTAMEYDGYGRLQSKHAPEQDAGTATVYVYNTDDTVYSVTDARGASATYGYNNRHEISAINYSAPAGITATPNASFGYDAAGNRISMSDGYGSQSYAYNQLSQLTSETRYFSPLGQYHTLSYDYNLAGELKKITDATGMTINYGYDAIGRVNAITGADNLYASVSIYASNFQYRAWNGLKAMTDGTNHTSSVAYNWKMQPSSFDISGGVVHQNYDYNNDGRISVVHNTTDQNFDRSYSYDQAGRMIEANSGGLVNGYQYAPIPYHETFGYDAFSNLTARGSDSWDSQATLTDSATYTANRRDGWGYDVDGRNTSIDTRTNVFDAVGRHVQMTAQQVLFNGNHVTTTENMSYDADGTQVSDSTSGTTSYYLRSSALGGKIIEELSSSGQKNIGYVYTPNGREAATQSYGAVTWKQTTPLATTELDTYSNSSVVGRTELDPVGANISVTEPESPPPSEGEGDIGAGHIGGIMDARWSDFFNTSSGCSVPGVAASCSGSMSLTNMDAEMRSFFGYQWYDLPGNANEMAQGEARYESLMGGFDPEFSRFAGTLSVTINGTVIKTINNPTLDQYQELQTAYGDDTYDVDYEHNVVTIYGGAEYFATTQKPSGGGVRTPLTGDRKKQYETAREQAKHLSDQCKKFLSGRGFSDKEIKAISGTIGSIRAFDGLTSTLGMYDAGLSNKPEDNIINVQEEFLLSDRTTPDSTFFADTAHWARAAAGATPRDVYFGLNGLTALSILHEALHIQTGLNDPDLANKLDAKIPKGSTASEEISNTLHANGCF